MHQILDQRVDGFHRVTPEARGIAQLYSHQAEAIEHALAGRNVVVTTPTASGKTLCYNAPVISRVLQDPSARALYLFPTKALAQDQLAELHELTQEINRAAEVAIGVFTYDGDTPQDARRAIRTRAHVVLSNPDMLHAGVLPHHPRWAKLFENLRFVVIDELYQPFLAKFTAAMTSAKTGDPTADDCQLGPLSSSTAADRLQDQLDRAIKGGAKVVAGGERDGNYFSPMVLTDVTPDNDAYREELFGPVAVVYRVGSEEEAVKLANDTPFGLGSYLFTTDPEQADRVANNIEAGMVYVNIVGADGAELPFGGVKRSGWGRELGKYGADEFVNKKLIRVG